jgi:hypothetical protein
MAAGVRRKDLGKLDCFLLFVSSSSLSVEIEVDTLLATSLTIFAAARSGLRVCTRRRRQSLEEGKKGGKEKDEPVRVTRAFPRLVLPPEGGKVGSV